jgi:hypothetical protein
VHASNEEEMTSGSYIGACGYFAMLDSAPRVGHLGDVERFPIYHHHSKLVVRAMLPANQIDRLLRPHYWKGE